MLSNDNSTYEIELGNDSDHGLELTTELISNLEAK